MALRKMLTLMLTVLFLAQVLLPGASYAQGVSVVVDGEPVELTDAPREINGRLFLPMRSLFEALGAEVSWDDATQTAVGRLGDRAAEFTVGYHVYIKYWTPDRYMYQMLDESLRTINGKLYLPVRAAGEGLGYRVRWDGAARTVYLEKMEPGEDEFVFEVYYDTGEYELDEEMTAYIRSLSGDKQIEEMHRLDSVGYDVRWLTDEVYRIVPRIVEERLPEPGLPDDSIFSRPDVGERFTMPEDFYYDESTGMFKLKGWPSGKWATFRENVIPDANKRIVDMAKAMFMENHTVSVSLNLDNLDSCAQAEMLFAQEYPGIYTIYPFSFYLQEKELYNYYDFKSFASMRLTKLERYNRNVDNPQYNRLYPPYTARIEKALSVLLDVDDRTLKEVMKFALDTYIKRELRGEIDYDVMLKKEFGDLQVLYRSGTKFPDGSTLRWNDFDFGWAKDQ
ncbi:hypothetical protein H0A61_02997 [Koleobacter methoxysyntrophicus]|uniref:Copper amine oxidase-like N-terminal domain-containing protein n=1 Tax=Koleobacter methoxysyntrophicus TaxID=2751313 RepID=A0A8A0RTE3_9FIRM|nr:copper amine oxidase N-terminal domain-containing protein [Koleobacter methoxysyntrophicus]QSQ10587.1 hypothetical protein H0A61_02997 [Koleobacter methoxysyntrophicus]